VLVLEVLHERADNSSEIDVSLRILRGKREELRRGQVAGRADTALPQPAVEPLRCTEARADRKTRVALRAERGDETLDMRPQYGQGREADMAARVDLGEHRELPSVGRHCGAVAMLSVSVM
jgi:hypothetical protein